jgi:hypothetical protein
MHDLLSEHQGRLEQDHLRSGTPPSSGSTSSVPSTISTTITSTPGSGPT